MDYHANRKRSETEERCLAVRRPGPAPAMSLAETVSYEKR